MLDDSILIDHIFEDAQTLYALLDTEMNFIRVNKAYAKIDGKEPEYFVGKNHFELYPNEENEEIFKRCIHSGKNHYAYAKSFDYEFNPERGTTYWDWSLQLVRNNQGEVVALLMALIDVSKRIQAEQLLNKAQEIANIGTWNWDIKNDNIEWTDEVYRIFERKPHEFEASYKHFLELVHPDDVDRIKKGVQQSFRNPGKIYSIEHRIPLKNGELKYVEEHGKVYCDIDNKPSRMIGTIVDVTTRKLHELAIEQNREQLELLVNQRTQELVAAQDEVMRSEKLATLGKLTATIGHELRNPLAAMRPSLYLLRNAADNEKKEKFLATIERNIERCDGIIEELLDFSRSPTLNKKALPLHQWLHGLLNEIALPSELSIAMETNAAQDYILADPNRLARALTNIIDNAVSAMQTSEQSQELKSDATLRFITKNKDSTLELIVEDNGRGIPDELLPKIMEPLFSTKNFGVGLGMGIIAQIVKEHDGSMKIESEVGIGTRILIYLPLSDQ